MLTITRNGSFDAGHRVMNERFKCFNLHGHTYLYEISFTCTTLQDIGYTVDFKEIKRVHQQFIDDYFDHGFIANPADSVCIKAALETGSKLWVMGKKKQDYCNPTVENIAYEIGICMVLLTDLMNIEGLKFRSIKLNETPNCYAFVDGPLHAFKSDFLYELCYKYVKEKGKLEYDDRKIVN